MSKRKMKDSGVEWLGEIPAEWDVIRFKYIASSMRKGNGITKDEVFEDGDVPCVRYGEIYSRYGFSVEKCVSRTRMSALKDPVYVNSGDLLFACTGELVEEIGKNVVYKGKTPCVAGGDILVATHGQNPSFMNYYLNCHASQFQKSRGKAKLKVVHARTSDIGNLVVLVPPVKEQRKIAAYLDGRCAKIDEMVSDAKKTIEEYKAWKSSVIFEAVTGKCKIENGECKIGGWAMRESGVEWIGMIPEGWRVNRVKRIVRVENGSDPLTEGSIPVYGSGESSFKTCGEFKEGPTVLLGRKGATLHIPHYIEGRYWNVDTAFDVRMKGNDNLRWFYYLAISFDYKAYISKTTLPSMTQSNYNNMHVPHPPVTEQCAIAAFLDKKCAAIDRVIAEKESLVADLEAYKKSLIFECVTGKMEVA